MLADRVALLFDGRLQQYDTPRGFYERPGTARIAQFFGGQNFIGGRKQGSRFVSPLGVFDLNGVSAPKGTRSATVTFAPPIDVAPYIESRPRAAAVEITGKLEEGIRAMMNPTR